MVYFLECGQVVNLTVYPFPQGSVDLKPGFLIASVKRFACPF